MANGRLAGKVALVTGASSGIGEATALALAAEGVAVAIGARRAERIDALADKIAADGGRALALDLDVTQEQQAHDAVGRTRADLGGLDIVVNNAGVMLLGPILNADTSDWRRMIETNVLGLMYVTNAALPHLVEQGSGDIVQVSSVAGRLARDGSGVYNASKWAVNAFSESLRQEVTARGVRVTLVEPGAVATELSDHITHAESKQRVKDRVTKMRALQSSDIAAGVVYVVTQPAHVSVNEVLIRPTDQVG
ncbi:MAG: SDR family NAD(P)-dependent oxidoreductase [Actinomycetota bacterium]|jgi:NADP-dependent 3-hydroxy acid dehydrogenase YdfG|nr:SDR family NAD(P)-dependent oxidoreductase [Actinomycetota bacterium]